MSKKIFHPPLIAASITFLVLSGIFFLTATSTKNYEIENSKEHYLQAQSHKEFIQNEIDSLLEKQQQSNQAADPSAYQSITAQIQAFQEQIEYKNNEIILLKNEMAELQNKAKGKKVIFLLMGVGGILIVSFSIGLIVFLLLRFNILKKVKLKRVLYLISFWVSFVVMLIQMAEKNETPSICFALISVGFLIAHNLTKLTLQQKETDE